MRQIKRLLCPISWLVAVSVLFATNTLANHIKIQINQTHMTLPFWPANVAHYGAVILVSGGEQSQCSSFLAQCAEQLAHYGWSVVLLNCTENKDTPWIEQLPKIISTLRKDNNKRIILVHYGDQLNQSFAYFSKPQSKMVNGLVMISAYDAPSSTINPKNLRFPLFDIAGQFDYAAVLTQMTLRAKEFKQSHYIAMEIPGAHHDYEYSQRLLLAFIHGWMTKLPEIHISTPPILVSYIEPIPFKFASLCVLNVCLI